jgi:hypothetical protein
VSVVKEFPRVRMVSSWGVVFAGCCMSENSYVTAFHRTRYQNPRSINKGFACQRGVDVQRSLNLRGLACQRDLPYNVVSMYAVVSMVSIWWSSIISKLNRYHYM